MILPRQKVYDFNIFLLVKSILNLNFFYDNKFVQQKLEKKISNFTKTRFCTLVPRARVGLKIILNFIKIKNSKKNRVLMASFTIFDIVNMVVSENLKPDFFDINKTDFSINLKNLKKKINKNTLALILTHYHVEPSEYVKIVNYCKTKDIYLIEDRAIAFRKAEKKEVLNKKHFIIYSFGPFKFISTIDLGAVVTNNLNYHKIINQYKKKFTYKNFLFKFSKVFFILKFYIASRNLIFQILFYFIKISEIFNVTNIKNLLKNDPNPERYNKKKEKNYFLQISDYQTYSAIYQINSKVQNAHKERHKRAKIYSKYLSRVKSISFKKYTYNIRDCYLGFPILCKNRNDLYNYLIKNNIDISKYFYRDCNQISIFKKYKSNCPNAKYISNHILLLPLYPNYPIDKIKSICNKIKDYYS
jgi:dTDP-4-amino-4,6-dideoxygalactose transaminase